MSFRRLGLLLALPTMVGLSLAACGTEDDAAPGPSPGGSGPTAGNGGTDETGGTGGNGASGGNPEGGMGGSDEPGLGGAGGDSAGGAGGDSAGGSGGDAAGAGGEGGAAPVGCHTILQAFDSDPAGAMGTYLTPETGPVQSSTVVWNSNEGVTLKGAGQLNATFGASGEQAQLSLYFTNAVWTCTTKMHAKVKLVATALNHVNGVTLNINTANWTRYSSKFTSTATWTTDTWYSIELPFASADYMDPANTLPDFNNIQAIGVMIQTKSDVTPIPTTLYVDDVWVE